MSTNDNDGNNCPSYFPFSECGGKGKCINGKCICDSGWEPIGDLYFDEDSNDCVTYLPVFYVLHSNLLVLSCLIFVLSINCFLQQFRNYMMKKEKVSKETSSDMYCVREHGRLLSSCFSCCICSRLDFFVHNVSNLGFRKFLKIFPLSNSPSHLFSIESLAFSILGTISSLYRCVYPLRVFGKDPFITFSYIFMFFFVLLLIVNFIHAITNFLAGVSKTMAASMRRQAINDTSVMYSAFPMMKLAGFFLPMSFFLCLVQPEKTRTITMVYDILITMWISFSVFLFLLKAANPMIQELKKHLNSLDAMDQRVVEPLRRIHWKLKLVRLIVLIVYPLVACGWILFGVSDALYRLNVYFIPFSQICAGLLVAPALHALSNNTTSDSENKTGMASNKVSIQEATSDKIDKGSGQKSLLPATPKVSALPKESSNI